MAKVVADDQKNIGAEFTHLYVSFIVLGDHRDPPQPWTLTVIQ